MSTGPFPKRYISLWCLLLRSALISPVSIEYLWEINVYSYKNLYVLGAPGPEIYVMLIVKTISCLLQCWLVPSLSRQRRS